VRIKILGAVGAILAILLTAMVVFLTGCRSSQLAGKDDLNSHFYQVFPAEMQNSKVVTAWQITGLDIDLKGRVTKIEDRTVTLSNSGDDYDITMREDTMAPIKGQPKRLLEMEDIQEGQNLIVVAQYSYEWGKIEAHIVYFDEHYYRPSKITIVETNESNDTNKIYLDDLKVHLDAVFPAEMQNSKVVTAWQIMGLRVDLKGQVTKVEGRIVTLSSSGDDFDITMREDAVSPTMGQPQRTFKMEDIQEGQNLIVVAIYRYNWGSLQGLLAYFDESIDDYVPPIVPVK